MATVYSTQFNNAFVRQDEQVKLNPGDFNGKMHIMYAEYEGTVNLQIGDIIKFCKIPKGARVINSTIVNFTSKGASTVIEVGYLDNGVDGASQDGLGSPNTTGSNVDRVSYGPYDGLYKRFEKEAEVVGTVTGGNWTASAGKIHVVVNYVYD